MILNNLKHSIAGSVLHESFVCVASRYPKSTPSVRVPRSHKLDWVLPVYLWAVLPPFLSQSVGGRFPLTLSEVADLTYTTSNEFKTAGRIGIEIRVEKEGNKS